MHRLKTAALAAALILLVAGAATAQGLPMKPALGLKAGANWSSMEVTGAGTSNRTGFTGGAFAKLPLGSIKLQIEALYSQKGFAKSSFTGPGNETITGWDVRIAYLDLPVMVNVTIPMPSVKPYLFAGYNFGVRLSADQKHSGTGGEWEDVSDGIKSTAGSLVFGVGLRKDRFMADFRFNHGVTNVSNLPQSGEIEDRTFALSIGYAIFD